MDPKAVIPSFPLQAGTTLAQSRHSQTVSVTLASPAVDVMTDLVEVKAATTNPSTTLRQAEQIMIIKGVRMLFVVSDRPGIQGLVTTIDLHGERQMRLVQERQLTYAELCVADVMTDLSKLDTVDFSSLRSACVGNVIETLKRLGRNHLLAVESNADGTARRVRGVFSRTQIERQTGTTIDIVPIAQSFADVEKALI